MVGDEKSGGAPKTSVVRVCPSCGKTAHIDRKYCDCHADLRRAAVAHSADPPAVGRCNFESPELCCADCPSVCPYCASFGMPATNGAGFGGKDCRHNSGTTLCSCCRTQIKIGADLRNEHFFRGVVEAMKKKGETGEEAGNLFFEAAGIICDAMTQPVLNRINRAMEGAG